MKTVSALFGILFFFVVIPTAPADEGTPTVSATPDAKVVETQAKTETSAPSGPIEELKKRMEDLFATSRKVNAPGGEGAKARAEIGTAMDWERIAQDAIGRSTWKKQPSKRQTEFMSLLREVIEKTAYSRLDKFWAEGTTYKFEKVDVKGSEGHVPTRFTLGGKGFVLEYYLVEKRKHWLIHDIAYEGLRYSENIHEQIDSFLKEKSFPELLDKLRKRRDELSEDEAKPKSS